MKPHFFFILLCSFLGSFPATTQSKPSSAELSFAQEKRLVVLGDSLTEGYGVAKEAAFPFILQQKLNSQLPQKDPKQAIRWKVINSGISGSTTASAPGRMTWIFKSQPHIVLLILGANDGLRGLKISDSEKNLSQAIERAQAKNVRVILGGLYMPPNYGAEYTQQFKSMYQRLAKKHKVDLIPFILDKVAGDPKHNLSDGIHPNEKGHAIIADNIFTVIKDKL